MRIIRELPPNHSDILKVFPFASNPEILYAFGDAIYTASQSEIPHFLLRHEEAHGIRQLTLEGGVEAWWDAYLSDVKFRYVEELVAHRVEYEARIEGAVNRQQRRLALKEVARRLSAPMYGSMKSAANAKKDIMALV